MYSIIVRKRFLWLLLIILSGLGLLIGGFLEIPSQLWKKEKTVTVPGGEDASGPVTALSQDGEKNTAPPRLTAAEKNNLDFFIEYRLDRERTRGRQIELLREILNNHAASAQARQRAQEELLAITNKLAKEMELEHLLRAKGYQDATVCIADQRVTVIVQPGRSEASAKLSPEDVTRICEIVSWGTGVGEQNIVVIPKI